MARRRNISRSFTGLDGDRIRPALPFRLKRIVKDSARVVRFRWSPTRMSATTLPNKHNTATGLGLVGKDGNGRSAPIRIAGSGGSHRVLSSRRNRLMVRRSFDHEPRRPLPRRQPCTCTAGGFPERAAPGRPCIERRARTSLEASRMSDIHSSGDASTNRSCGVVHLRHDHARRSRSSHLERPDVRRLGRVRARLEWDGSNHACELPMGRLRR